MHQRASTVRPSREITKAPIDTLSEGRSDLDADREDDAAADTGSNKDELEEKIEDLHRRVAQQFEDDNDERNWKTPIIKAPHQPTEEEWARHCVTHTLRTNLGVHIAWQDEQSGGSTRESQGKRI